MNSIYFLAEFKELLDRSYSNHIRINNDTDAQISENLKRSQSKNKEKIRKIENLEAQCDNELKNFEDRVKKYRDDYNVAIIDIMAANDRYNKALQNLSQAKKTYENEMKKISEYFGGKKAAYNALLDYIKNPVNKDLAESIKGFVSRDLYLKIYNLKQLSIYSKIFLKGDRNIINVIKTENFTSQFYGCDAQYFEEYYYCFCRDFAEYSHHCSTALSVLGKQGRLSNLTYNFERLFWCFNVVEKNRGEECLKCDKTFRLDIDEKTKQVAFYGNEKNRIEMANESPEQYEKKAKIELDEKIRKIKERINILKNEEDKVNLREQNKEIYDDARKKHREETLLLEEKLAETLSEEKINELLKMNSFIECCDNYSTYRCPSEFGQHIVLGKISFDYRNDPKLGQFEYIYDTVDSYLKNNGFNFPIVDDHMIFEIPFVIDMADFNGVHFVYDSQNFNLVGSAYKSVILHLFTDICPGSTIFTMIDGIQPSGIFAPFSRFIKSKDSKWINNKIYNDSEEIQNVLEKIKTQVVERTANFTYDNIVSANETLIVKKTLNIMGIALENGMEEKRNVINEESRRLLSSIVAGGKHVGYYCFSISNSDTFVNDIYNDNYTGVVIKYNGESNRLMVDYMSHKFDLKIFPYPENEICEVISERIADSYEHTIANTYTLVDSKIYEVLGQNAKAIDNISVSAAVDIDNHFYNFVLDDKNLHYLILGIPRKGKSRFLHTLITNIIRKYSPNDINLYLMSYKGEATEISAFTKSKIPHFKIINTSQNGFAFKKFMEYLVTELNRRDGIFKENGSGHIFVNYSEYMKAYYSGAAEFREMEYLPRIVVVIDEIQEALQCSADVTEDIKRCFASIFNTAGCFGIHLVFATQKLSNITDSGIKIEFLKSISKVMFDSIPEDVNALMGNTGMGNDSINMLMDSVPGHAFVISDSKVNEVYTPMYSITDEENVLAQLEIYYNDTFDYRSRVIKRTFSEGFDNIYSKFIKDPASVKFENTLCIGEEIDFENECHTKISLKNPENDNIMLLGTNSYFNTIKSISTSDSVITSLYLSLLGHLITSGEYKKSEVIFANCGEINKNNIILNVYRKLSTALEQLGEDRFLLRYIPCGELSEQLDSLLENYAKNISDILSEVRKVYLFLYGIHNSTDLDRFYNYLNTINERYDKFIHIIVWSDGREYLTDFIRKTGMEKSFRYKFAYTNDETDCSFILGRKDKVPDGVIKMKTLSFDEPDPCFIAFDYSSRYDPENKANVINKYVEALKAVIKINKA